MECLFFGICVIVAFFIICSIVDKKMAEKARIQAIEERIKYIESLNLDTALSNNIREYLKTGRLNNDYYSNIPYNYKNYYSEITKKWSSNQNKIEEVVHFYKEKLLYNISHGIDCTDYQTKYGTVREVYLGKLNEHKAYNCGASDAYVFLDKFGRVSVDTRDSGKCECIPIIKTHGFELIKYSYDDFLSTEMVRHIDTDYYVYAYIKI